VTKLELLVYLVVISNILLYTCLVAFATRIGPQIYSAHVALQIRAHHSLDVIGEHNFFVIDLQKPKYFQI